MKRGNKKFRTTQADNARKRMKKKAKRDGVAEGSGQTPPPGPLGEKLESWASQTPEADSSSPNHGVPILPVKQMRKLAKWIIRMTNLEAHLLGRNIPTLRFLAELRSCTVSWLPKYGDVNHPQWLIARGVNCLMITFGWIWVTFSWNHVWPTSLVQISGQSIINPYPECFGHFWVGIPYFSLPFGVTSAARNLQDEVW